MNEEIIFKLVFELNRWWTHGRVLPEYLPSHRRSAFKELLNFMDTRQIISLFGPRRVGKTTLLYQMIDYLINDKKVNPKNIFYFSFDELIASEKPDAIEKILTFYFNSVLEKGPRAIEETAYVILDEIQYVRNWQATLKRYYDLRYRIKFFITGSSTVSIKFRQKESLAGRIYDLRLDFLTFAEYVKLKEFDCKAYFGLFDKPQEIRKLYRGCLMHEGLLKRELDEYIIKGGYPELLHEKDPLKIQQYILNSSLEKVIYKDLVIAFKIKDAQLLSNILTFAADNTANIFEILTLSRDLKSSRVTIANYISYLKDAFLVEISRNYARSRLKSARTNKKIYVTDSGVISSILKYGKEILKNKPLLGNIIETIVFNSCRRQCDDIFFWRDKQKREVDLVLGLKRGILPVEVKYKNKVTTKDLNGVRAFASKFKTKRAIVVTDNLFKADVEYMFIPLWFFLSYLKYEESV